MRSVLPVAGFLLGLAALLYGVWQLSEPWAFIIGGAALLLGAWFGELAE